MTCGIYKITENETGKAYVGQSINIEKRWWKHRKRFLPDLFSYEIIMECERIQLDFWEIAWIASENTHHPNGFNHTIGGSGAWGSKNPEETRKKIADKKRGKPRSEETKAKIANTLTGRPLSEEHKAKLSKASIISGTKPPNALGKKWYNNGQQTILRKEHPGNGWNPGRKR